MDTRLRTGAGRALVATGAAVALLSFGLSGPAQAGVTGDEVVGYEASSLQTAVLVGDTASGYVRLCSTVDTCAADEVSYAVTAGALAPGVSLNADGTISGTYTTAGTYTVTITATMTVSGVEIDLEDLEGAWVGEGYVSQGTLAGPATFPWTVVVSEPEADGYASVYLSHTLPATGTVGEPLSGDVTMWGQPVEGPAVEITDAAFAVLAGPLPGGLSLDVDTGTVTGTPTQSGTFAVVIEGSASFGSGGGFASTTWDVTIAEPPTDGEITATLPRGVVGAPYAGTVTGTCADPRLADSLALGEDPPADLEDLYGQTGLPAGLVLDADTGEVTGTPTAAGTFPVGFTFLCPDGTVSATADLLVTLPAIAPSPVSVAQGGTVALTGTGFVGEDTLTLFLNSERVGVGQVDTDATGAFLAQIVLPASAPVGAHQLEAVSEITGSVFTDLTIVAAGGSSGATGGGGAGGTSSGGGAATTAAPTATTATAPTDLATTGAETWLAGLAAGLVLMGAGLVLEGRRLRPWRIAA